MMNRRSLFRLLAGAAAAVAVNLSQAFARPARIPHTEPTEAPNDLSWIEKEFPGVKVYGCCGQVFFPVYSSSGLTNALAAILYKGQLSEWTVFEAPGISVYGFQQGWQITDQSKGSYAFVQFSHETLLTGPSTLALPMMLRRAAHALLHDGPYKFEATTSKPSFLGRDPEPSIHGARS